MNSVFWLPWLWLGLGSLAACHGMWRVFKARRLRREAAVREINTLEFSLELDEESAKEHGTLDLGQLYQQYIKGDRAARRITEKRFALGRKALAASRLREAASQELDWATVSFAGSSVLMALFATSLAG